MTTSTCCEHAKIIILHFVVTNWSTCMHEAAVKVKSLQFSLNTGSLLILSAQEPNQTKPDCLTSFSIGIGKY